MQKFREDTPTRQYKKKPLKSYRSYKKYLAIDFNKRCAYCNASDTWLGGIKSYHVDHFAPKDKFSHLEHEYLNLMYACSHCNIAKSNKWPSTNEKKNIESGKGFYHPINDDYTKYFERDDEGNIIALDAIAADMKKELKLGLKRHAILWKLSQIEIIISECEVLLNANVGNPSSQNIQDIHYYYLKLFYSYHKIFRQNLEKE